MTDAPITQQEMDATLNFFKDHHIAWLGADGDKNGATFGDYLNLWADSTPTKQAIPITPKSLEIVFKQVQNSLIFYSPDEAQYHIYEEQYPSQLETIKQFLPTYRLSASDESLYVNTNIIMEYCISTGRVHQITKENLKGLIMGNLVNRPGVRALQWAATPKQDWQKERDRKATETERAAEHYRKYHQESDPQYREEQRRKREAEEIQNSNQSYWEQRVHSFIASLQRTHGNLVQAEAEAQFGNGKYGNWEVTFRELENFVDRKKNQPGHWY